MLFQSKVSFNSMSKPSTMLKPDIESQCRGSLMHTSSRNASAVIGALVIYHISVFLGLGNVFWDTPTSLNGSSLLYYILIKTETLYNKFTFRMNFDSEEKEKDTGLSAIRRGQHSQPRHVLNLLLASAFSLRFWHYGHRVHSVKVGL